MIILGIFIGALVGAVVALEANYFADTQMFVMMEEE